MHGWVRNTVKTIAISLVMDYFFEYLFSKTIDTDSLHAQIIIALVFTQ
jgi:hypothetical protein